MTATIHKSMPIEDYHAHKADSKSSLKILMDDCPARYRYKRDNPVEMDSKSIRIGSTVHTLALEPEFLEKTYHFLPEFYFNDKGEKKPWRNDERMQVYKDEVEKSNGRTMVNYNEFQDVRGMAKSLTDNPYALALLKSDGYVEASIFFDYEGEYIDENGEVHNFVIPLKCRPDSMRNDGLIVDLKTCRSAKPDIFFKDSVNMGYALSVAITCYGYEKLYGKLPDEYVFLAVESEAPYFVEAYNSFAPMYMSGMSYYDYGNIILARLMQKLAICRITNTWPQYNGKITPMKAPQWAIKQAIEG